MISDRYRMFLAALLLSVLVLAVYFNVQHFDFIQMDDPQYVVQSEIVTGGLSWDGMLKAFSTVQVANWHPLTTLSFMLDYQLFRLNAAAYHWNNVLLHLLASLLLLGTMNRITKAFWQSFFVALLFALHPLHVESVAWISERKDVLSALFCFLTIYAYSRYTEKPSIANYSAVILSYAAGLMTKPMLVTLPFVLLLLDYWPLKRFDMSQLKKNVHLVYEKTPLFVLSAASCIVTFCVQKSSEAVVSVDLISLPARISNALVSYAKYLAMTFRPVDLAVFYPHPGMPSLELLLPSVAVLVLITAAVLFHASRRPYLFVGWSWYLGTLVPVIGLVQVGVQAMADRYTYIPLVGIFIMIAWGIPDLLKTWRHKRIAMAAAGAAALCILTVLSWRQVQAWENSHMLFRHAVEVTRENSIAHSNLAFAYARQGDIEKAIRHFDQASKMTPHFPDTHNNLGVLLAQTGKYEEAIRAFRTALNEYPGYELARKNLNASLDLLAREKRK
ncbi:MAG TPA: tetratricopeptide repeat protein [Syntrophales bacterium]|nr:tetratricopeptide repeat protein [Syntrophales bacterium]